ncbi:MAG: triphosphoribosyl-dephospho-CoA synthetase [Planctomycetaceae bacterium]|nr:triphosphoribosyl-dephospho-CoA synthetase [Planctomycetaceae bacterium]MBT4723786.1 triphosphoribosyl-dephospho-CoA synthetase [Planctomycetaceae bacterium]MBT4846618.1 triphosphoribosyl-dephospho-CoA synthetase [Planctomycetaceae bacterium]MBT5126348.1 triphosphoribosyl-dephospho-CoA synthetase [Planctomycetaceae bacterium]MBT5597352.1 triphosphoribosyl-dephospho-CoA synthetase [Planctomycetaceae bacterium]
MAQQSLGQMATLACLLEVSAPKPGNVHRGADFEDLTFYDFQTSAVAIGPVFDLAKQLRVGSLVLAAIQATQSVVSTNTNLGLMLLMAPLAKATVFDETAMPIVMNELTAADAQDIYQAIALADAGGMGEVESMDITDAAPDSLLEAMSAAQDHDLIAAQYGNGFVDLFADAVRPLREKLEAGMILTEAIVETHVQFMSRHPDSLIARKCGVEIAEEAARRARVVVDARAQGLDFYVRDLSELDFWLRSDGHRRNPGTTADFIGAAIFVGLIEGWLPTEQ